MKFQELAEQEKLFLKCLRKRAEREAKKKLEKEEKKAAAKKLKEEACQLALLQTLQLEASTSTYTSVLAKPTKLHF